MDGTTSGFSNRQRSNSSQTGHGYHDNRIYGGRVHMGDTHYNYYDDPLSRLDYSKNARFNSKNRENTPICHEGTRTDLLRDIYNWADGEDERQIFWLKGLAGTGKSTIARTVAKHYYDLDQKRLAASFFFARDRDDASHAGLFVTSIAVQLASDVPLLRDAVCMAITKCSDITNRSLGDQWRQLVLEPFLNLEVTHSQSSYLIVIDALDECNGDNDIQTILQLLSQARQLTSSRLRFLLTSRPETAIRRGFEAVLMGERQDTVLHEIAPAVVDHDIAIYINHELVNIGREQYLGPDWPTQWQVQQLVGQSSGLFIWAATACRYIREGRNHASERLSKVLETQTMDSAPEKELDAIYTMVLTNSVPENLSEEEKGTSYGLLNYILGSVVVLFTPLAIPDLHLLLDISLNEIKRTVIDLHSILHISPEESDELRLHHPSFRDYLVNPTRCDLESLQVDEKGAHRRLLMRCLLLMSATLKENICELDYSNPGILVAEVQKKRIQQYIHPALCYACLYWTQHLHRSGEMIYDMDQVDNFMRNHVLAWLEALSWMGRAAESIPAVTCLESIASTDTCPLFCGYIYDVKRVISRSYPIIEHAPLQLYLSALIFTPESSHIRIHFQERVFRWMKMIPVMENNWSSLLQTLEGHTGSVSAITFSPDGTMLASASDDGTVRLWNTATGSVRQIFEGHTGSMSAIAFSPDGTVLALASYNGTVRLWNTATGSVHQTLKGYTDSVNTITFSPDGTILASASYTGIVQLWNTATGSAYQALKGHTNSVNMIVFSPDGTMLASASYDGRVQLWNIATGSAHQIIKGHTRSVNSITFSPDGSMLASASDDGTVQLWDTATDSAHQTLKGHIRSVSAIAFSPDGTMLASASNDCTVRLWDTATGSVYQTFEGYTDSVNTIAFSPDGTILASGSYNGAVWLWNIAISDAHHVLEGHTRSVNAIVFSPDGTILASASDDGTVRLWDTAISGVHQTFEGYKSPVNAITFSPDGTMLASASNDGIIQLWNAAIGYVRQTFKGYSLLSAIAFSPDGTMLASASNNGIIQLWNIATGSVRQAFEGYTSSISAIAFSPDGTMLASASYNGTVRLWNTATGSACQTRAIARQIFEGYSDTVNTIAFSLDGTALLTNRGRINLLLDDITSDSLPQHSAPASALVINNPWIVCNGYNVLWLPPDYRSHVYALYATKVAIGCSSGRVLLFELHGF